MLIVGVQLPLPVKLISKSLQMIPLETHLRLTSLRSHEKTLKIKNETLLGLLVSQEKPLRISRDVPIGLNSPNGRQIVQRKRQNRRLLSHDWNVVMENLIPMVVLIPIDCIVKGLVPYSVSHQL